MCCKGNRLINMYQIAIKAIWSQKKTKKGKRKLKRSKSAAFFLVYFKYTNVQVTEMITLIMTVTIIMEIRMFSLKTFFSINIPQMSMQYYFSMFGRWVFCFSVRTIELYGRDISRAVSLLSQRGVGAISSIVELLKIALPTQIHDILFTFSCICSRTKLGSKTRIPLICDTLWWRLY